eukprot:TRINITY_DN41_c0_g1_i2.p1 TRINITY_DN41_c0_g1~~TRINITY_DN41_c0_g1_i2.p1  ORF type:complete len:299 (-),score=134.84 TRINITY_DN41_c0_g1_i2:294-1190(-)
MFSKLFSRLRPALAGRVSAGTKSTIFGDLTSWQMLGGAALGAAFVAGSFVAEGSSDEVHAPHLPWSNQGHFAAFDTASIRRGLMVYQQVCAACHSLQFLRYRHLQGVTHDEEGVKALAAKADVVDGPNDQGEMFTRPGRPTDGFPSPYPNDEAARFANGGALPPDLSLIVKARHHGQDYLFALLTGYYDAPAGVNLRQGLYFNPYFPGGAIAMPPPLLDGAVDYPDGTPNSASQMAKDVVTFLTWAGEPWNDEQKLKGTKLVTALFISAALAGYYKRWRWSVVKSRKVYWVDELKKHK